jgi:hypothetical protein
MTRRRCILNFYHYNAYLSCYNAEKNCKNAKEKGRGTESQTSHEINNKEEKHW